VYQLLLLLFHVRPANQPTVPGVAVCNKKVAGTCLEQCYYSKCPSVLVQGFCAVKMRINRVNTFLNESRSVFIMAIRIFYLFKE